MRTGLCRSFCELLLDVIYPRSCVACGGPVDENLTHVCFDCRVTYDYIDRPFCEICGDPVDGLIEHKYVCSWCEAARPCFVNARSAVRFNGALKHVIHEFKYSNGAYLVNDLGPLLVKCVHTNYTKIGFDCVTYVPLHIRRERERTYNQSALLARYVASDMDLPLLRCIRRSRPTASQVGLSLAERKQNVKHAFIASSNAHVGMRTVLLVDDVITTGATVNECARALLDAGAARVYVASVARG
ncbi:MAG: ComF family protein [Lentisphaerae bacterium]|nr:ComF family protein [Lentisphaerota bacterium]